MARAEEYLAEAARALLEADDQAATPSAQVPLIKAMTALTMAVMSIAVELGVAPPDTPGDPPAEVPGQQVLTY